MKKFYNSQKDGKPKDIPEKSDNFLQRKIGDDIAKAAQFIKSEMDAAQAAQNARIKGEDPEIAAAKVRSGKSENISEEDWEKRKKEIEEETKRINSKEGRKQGLEEQKKRDAEFAAKKRAEEDKNKKPSKLLPLNNVSREVTPEEMKAKAMLGTIKPGEMPGFVKARTGFLAEHVQNYGGVLKELVNLQKAIVSGQEGGFDKSLENLVTSFKKHMPTLSDDRLAEIITKQPELLQNPPLPRNQERAITHMAMGLVGQMLKGSAKKTTPVATAEPISQSTVMAAKNIDLRNAQYQQKVEQTIAYNNKVIDVFADNAQAYFSQMTDIERAVVTDAITTLNTAHTNMLNAINVDKQVAVQRDANAIAVAQMENNYNISAEELKLGKLKQMVSLMGVIGAMEKKGMESSMDRKEMTAMVLNAQNEGMPSSESQFFFQKAHVIEPWIGDNNINSVADGVSKQYFREFDALEKEVSEIKAMVRDPSAKRRLSKLGMRKATKNASATRPAPKKCATTTSRTRPKMRLIKVNKPTVPAARLTLSLSD